MIVRNHPVPTSLVRRWEETGWWENTTLADRFDAAVQAYPDALLTMVSDQRPAEMTLRDFDWMARRIASGLAAAGIARGDVVAIQSPACVEALATFAGALRLGVTVMPIVHIYGPTELAFILGQSGAKVLVTPDTFRTTDYRDVLKPALETHAGVNWFVIGDPGQSGARPFDDLSAFEPWDRASIGEATDIALLIYTSGTTSAPKGVQHSHQTIGAELRSWREARARLSPILSPWPIGHVAGFLGFLRFAAAGCSTVFMDSWNGERAAQLIAERGIQATAGTPLHVGTTLDAADAAGHDLSSLIDYQAGATTIPASLIERCERRGLHLYKCYGSSEHPTVSMGRPSDPLDKRLSTDGKPLFEIEVRFVDDEGHDVPMGTEGEIALRGPDQFVGYRDTSLNESAFLPGGWFLTGDIGRLDADGYLSITDRKKDVIIRGGENISSREVEDHLLAHPMILDAAAVGRADPRFGERVCACVVLAEGGSLDLPQLVEWFASRGVAKQKTPEHLVVLDQLPKNASGKIVKQELRRAAA